MKPELVDLIEMGRGAGEILRQNYGREHEIGFKGKMDLVTEVDRLSEDYIIEAIRNRFPDHTIVAEESGQLAGSAEHAWYIDPLDGTVNYAHSLPIFSVSLAYAYQSQVTLGVVYDPMADHCFSAERGHGAWLNDQSIHASTAAELVDALLVTGFPYDTWNNSENNLDNFVRFSRLSQGVRRLGSAALDFCYVAAGWLDGYWEIKLRAWDIAAGGLIAEEAGVKVTALDGRGPYLVPPYSFLAANAKLHARMLEVLTIVEDEPE